MTGQVGARGQSAVLSAGARGNRVWITVTNALNASVAVEVSVEEAEAFVALLVQSARAARRNKPNQRRDMGR